MRSSSAKCGSAKLLLRDLCDAARHRIELAQRVDAVALLLEGGELDKPTVGDLLAAEQAKSENTRTDEMMQDPSVN